jgi:hypothetical protein
MNDNTITRCTRTTLTTLTKLFSVLLMGLLAFDTTAQTQNPNIRIISPKGNATARGTVTIQGSANPAGFGRYELSYSQEPEPTTWVTVGASNQSVDNNTLGTWNTRPLPDGGYALRLQVFGADNVFLGESVLRNITLTNRAANVVVITTDTLQSGNAITSSVTVVRSGNTSAFSISDIPRGFVRGATYTVYGFAALGAYVMLKQLVKFLWKRYGRRAEIRE